VEQQREQRNYDYAAAETGERAEQAGQQRADADESGEFESVQRDSGCAPQFNRRITVCE
jgi:hypothetical protein